MSNEWPDYLSYLLRMWRVQEDGGTGWRVSLERPGNRRRHTFASLEEAFHFLRQRAASIEGEAGDGSP